jgi:low affinity Fe/Cu permease
MNDGITLQPPPVPPSIWLDGRIDAPEGLDLYRGAPELPHEATAALTAARLSRSGAGVDAHLPRRLGGRPMSDQAATFPRLDRFQELAATLAEKAGAWQHFAFWALAVCVWIGVGPRFRWSDSWQLMVNTPTTVYKLFLGLAILVDGARQIVMLQQMLSHVTVQQDRLERIEQHVLRLLTVMAAYEGITDDAEVDTPL